MCGFVAIMSRNITKKEEAFIKEGVKKISHRGPDDEGFFFNGYQGLGFRRLSFIDVATGIQPYTTSDTKYTCVFNGEIYNYRELKAQLVEEGVHFETQSEVEVILGLYDHYGEDFASKLRGMFAIVILDHRAERLVAVRDGFGIKPLYYKQEVDSLSLASELKVFKPGEGYDIEALNLDGLTHYFTFQYVPEEETVIKGINHLPAGSVLTYDFKEGLTIRRYQPLKLVLGSTVSQTPVSKVRDVIVRSIHAHMASEFEIGTFLSGGIDSTIVASIAKQVNPNIKAFSIGYDLDSHSELVDAQMSADALGIDLRTRKVSAYEYMDAVRKSVYHLDSPLADPSAVMFYLLSEFAVSEVKAALSGEGADELFGGYPIYQEVDGLKLFTRVPDRVKKGLLSASSILPVGTKGKGFLERGCTPLRDRYAGNAFIFSEDEKTKLLRFSGHPWKRITDPLYDVISHLDRLEQMQTIDFHTWLKGDILLKADRLSMAHRLEVRVPFLDEEVFKVARELSKEEKIKGKVAKSILREAFQDFLPDHMKNMKKRGFPVPLAHWMRNELYEEVREILFSEIAEPFINREKVLTLLEEHRRDKQDHSRKIWTVVVFVLWLERSLTSY